MARSKLDIKAGDLALMGTFGVSMPSDWFVCTVILVCDDEIATAHTPASSGTPQRQFWPISSVRAYGSSHAALMQFRDEARRTIEAEWRSVDAAKDALAAARDAAWKKLDTLGSAVPARMDGGV